MYGICLQEVMALSMTTQRGAFCEMQSSTKLELGPVKFADLSLVELLMQSTLSNGYTGSRVSLKPKSRRRSDKLFR